jgi:hypothetical protein
VFADEEVQLRVVGHPVALVRRAHDLAHARAVEPAADVARHVGEQQVLLHRVPDRPFGEGEARARLPDGRVLVDQAAERGVEGFVRHSPALTPGTSRAGARTG